MRTFSAKAQEVSRDWILIDAKNLPIGRVASIVASRLQGKHKPIYTRHVDTGDCVVIINTDFVKATGTKEITKNYYRHSGYPGGLKSMSLGEMRRKDSRQLIELAVKRMLPQTPLGRDMFRKLHVYKGASHDNAAQQPRAIEITQDL